MSYAVQILCGLALVFGVMTAARKVDSEQVRWAAVYVLVGVPLIAAYIVGTGRKVLLRIDQIEKRAASSQTERKV